MRNWFGSGRAAPVSSLGKADHSDLRAIALASTSQFAVVTVLTVRPSDSVTFNSQTTTFGFKTSRERTMTKIEKATRE